MSKSVKIYGLGWVGRSMKQMFPDAIVDDPEQGFFPAKSGEVAFVCVPTPLKEGKVDDSIVESVVARAKEDLIVMRSTVMPGTCDRLAAKYNKRIVFQPEYLGETISHPFSNQGMRQFIILGGNAADVEEVITIYQQVYNANVSIRKTTAYEAEVIKLSENRAIAFKVAQCQELYDACKSAGVDYNTVREAVYGDDPRFNLWFTFVYPDNRGFSGSKCLKKDVPAWATWAEETGASSELTKAMLEYDYKIINSRKL